MKDLLLYLGTSALAIVGTFLHLYGIITIVEFIPFSIPGMLYSVVMVKHPQTIFDMTTNYAITYYASTVVLTAASAYYLYELVGSGMYGVLYYYGITMSIYGVYMWNNREAYVNEVIASA